MEANEKFTPYINDYSIVLVGEFEPIKYTAKWLIVNEAVDEDLFKKGLLENEENVFSNELTKFKVNSVEIYIQKKKIIFKSLDPYDDSILKDTVEKFCNALGQHFIQAYGYNYNVSYYVNNVELFNKINDKILPFNHYDPTKDYKKDMNDGNRFAFSICSEFKKDNGCGYYQVGIDTIQDKVKKVFGFFISCNDHTVITDTIASQHWAEIIVKRIQKTFEIEKDIMIKLHDKYIGELKND